MNETFSDLIEKLRDNLISVIAVFMMVAILIGYLLFTLNSILPQWQMRSDLITRVAIAEEELAQSTQGQQTSVDSLITQINKAPDEIATAASFLISEAQANQFLSDLYQHASLSDVEIAELQTQSNTSSDTEMLYNIKQFQLRVNGDLQQLVAFLTRLKEVSQPSYILSNVAISEGAAGDSLTMNILLYTSPYAPKVPEFTVEANLGNTAVVTPLPIVEASPIGYKVRPGDTLLSISRQFNMSIATIRQANNLAGNGVSPDQELLIPR